MYAHQEKRKDTIPQIVGNSLGLAVVLDAPLDDWRGRQKDSDGPLNCTAFFGYAKECEDFPEAVAAGNVLCKSKVYNCYVMEGAFGVILGGVLGHGTLACNCKSMWAQQCVQKSHGGYCHLCNNHTKRGVRGYLFGMDGCGMSTP